jgi:hypothetical protein
MANRYGEAALMATRHVPSGDISPVARWESAMEKLYPTSAAARKKGCPRGAFLGLCEEGLVKGIPAPIRRQEKIRRMQSAPWHC